MKIIAALLCFFYAVSASAAHISSPGAMIDLTTQKTVTIVGPIDPAMEASVSIQLRSTRSLPGPTVVIIYSPGGYVESGVKIINMLKASKSRLICIAVGASHSMAFNILTHCDVRLATEHNQAIAHKIAIGEPDPQDRLTAKRMKQIARAIEEIDKQWDKDNAAALHLTKEQYDLIADAQKNWTSRELLARGYLHGIATLD